jgi:arylsulfatase A
LAKQYEAWFDDISSAGLARFPIQIGHAEENPVTLHAPQAYFGGGLKFFAGPGYAHDWLTGWSDASAKVWFETEVIADGDYELTLRYTCPAADAGSRLKVTLGDASREVAVPAFEPQTIRLPHRDEAGHAKYVNRNWGELPVGMFSLRKGPARLSIECLSKPAATVMDFKGLTLERR